MARVILGMSFPAKWIARRLGRRFLHFGGSLTRRGSGYTGNFVRRNISAFMQKRLADAFLTKMRACFDGIVLR